MTFLSSPYAVQKTILIINVIILIFSIFDLFLCFKRKAKPYYCTILETIIFLITSFILICLFSYVKVDYFNEIPNVSKWLINRPIWIYILLSILFISFSVSSFIIGCKFAKRHISNDSIKESFNNLPSGICFYDEDGLLQLANLKINDLCLKITGKKLLNGKDFWNLLTKNQLTLNCIRLKNGEKPIIKIDDFNIFSFKRNIHQIDGDIFYEIIATDITMKYNLSLDLEKKNNELKLFNERIRDYGENINEIIIAKETLNAKIHIHDELGRLLLLTRQNLSQDMNKQEVHKLISLWKGVLISFIGINQKKNTDSYNGLYNAAKAIGVTIEIIGEKPKDARTKNIVIKASVECITNTVKHANGNFVKIEIFDEKYYSVITITNNGKPPLVEIKEGGGLSSLRMLVEQEGGSMSIISYPSFMLKINVPKEK